MMVRRQQVSVRFDRADSLCGGGAAGQGQADKMLSVPPAALSTLFVLEIGGRLLKLTEVVTGLVYIC